MSTVCKEASKNDGGNGDEAPVTTPERTAMTGLVGENTNKGRKYPAYQ